MKRINVITFTAIIALLFSAAASAADVVEVRGEVKTVVDGATSTWTPDNFAGFFYDIDDGIGTEQLDLTITGNKIDEPTGAKYTSKAETKKFDFDAWGKYWTMGFLAKEYFAGYNEEQVNEATPFLYQQSNNRNLLTDEQLSEVLYDDDTEMTVTSGTPLKLKEGYELAIKAIDIDGNKVYVELTKDGAVVDSKVISPSKAGAVMSDKTYYYKKDIGDTKDLVIIGVNFKNAFRGAETNLATIDGVFQISDTPTSVEVDTEYGKMRIASVDATEKIITMDNKDNSITLSKNRDINLMENVNIKTADQDEVTADNPLRYYIYKAVTIEGEAETPAADVAAARAAEAAATEDVAAAEAVEAAAAENVTEAEAVAAEAAPVVVEEHAAEPAPAATNETPGFGSIFALTGLLAVAYLVLNRRE